MRYVLSIAVLIVSWPAKAEAQVYRYDLGQRLRKMERAWNVATPANRAKSVEPLKKAIPYFFADKNVEAAAVLDETRFVLEGRDLSPAERWANSLIVRPSARIVDPADGSLSIKILPCYDSKLPIPANVNIRFFLANAADPQILAAIPLDKIPATATIATSKLPPGDHVVFAQIIIESEALAEFSFGLSVVPKYRERLDALKNSVAKEPAATSLESSTARELLKLMQSIAAGDVPETDYPLARLLRETETITAPDAKDKPYYTLDRPGQYWLTLPFPNSEVRIFVPKGLSSDRPVPVVVAMHGAGGSENMFFDTYGNGATMQQCRERGWIMIGTRAVGFFNGGPPVGRIVEELAQRYPIDLKRVFIMGHSMGAAQTIEAVQKYPGKFAAAAALGGGASARNAEALKNLPVYVACGSEDFALSAAKALVRSLEKAEAKVQYHEYPKIEHIVIVQAAIKELFGFFESAGR